MMMQSDRSNGKTSAPQDELLRAVWATYHSKTEWIESEAGLLKFIGAGAK